MEPLFVTTADGRELAWAEYGDPAGEPVFTFHGTPGSRLDRDPFDAPTAVRIIAPDRPGYGRSAPQPGRTLADWPIDVCTIADALGLTRFSVVGISGGGPHALACAAYIPERLHRVGVICGLGPLERDGATDGMMPMNHTLLETARNDPEAVYAVGEVMAAAITADADAALAMMRGNLPLVDQDTLAIPEVYAMMRASQVEAMRQGGRAFADEQVMFAQRWGFDLADITVPVHLWHGVLDVNVPVSHAHDMAEQIPGATLTVFADDGHMSLALTKAAACVRELLR